MFKAFFKYKATISYIVLIVIINALFGIVPFVTLLGETVSPVDVTVGSIYVLRDFAQREIKSYVLVAMFIGGFLSYIFADKTVAFASMIAFMTGELIDWVLFTYTKKPLSQRLILSSVCSCPIDSIVFLGLLGRLNWLELTIMTLFKFVGIFWVWGFWKVRQPNQVLA